MPPPARTSGTTSSTVSIPTCPTAASAGPALAVDPETGNVYANGVQGLVLCLDRDGKLLWSKSTTELFGRVSGYGGRTYTPIIDEDRVIVAFNNSSFGSHAVGAHRFLALDKKTGEILWWSTPGGRPEDPTYSNPVVAVINGQRLIIAGNADGNLYAVKARTGEKVWGFMASKRGLNASPVVDGYRVYITHSEENYDSTLDGPRDLHRRPRPRRRDQDPRVVALRRHRRRLCLAAVARRAALRDEQ